MVSQYRNVRPFLSISCFQASSFLSLAVCCVLWNAFFCSFFRATAQTWCACLVLAMWEQLMNDSAVPGLARPPFAGAFTHPEPAKYSPTVFQTASSMWRPPNITTYLSSLWVWGHFHCMYFAKTNNGTSNAMIVICTELTNSYFNLITLEGLT